MHGIQFAKMVDQVTVHALLYGVFEDTSLDKHLEQGDEQVPLLERVANGTKAGVFQMIVSLRTRMRIRVKCASISMALSSVLTMTDAHIPVNMMVGLKFKAYRDNIRKNQSISPLWSL